MELTTNRSRRFVLATVAIVALLLVVVSLAVHAPLLAGAVLVSLGIVLASNAAHATSAWADLTVELRRRDILWRLSWPFNREWSGVVTRLIGIGLIVVGAVLIVSATRA